MVAIEARGYLKFGIILQHFQISSLPIWDLRRSVFYNIQSDVPNEAYLWKENSVSCG